MVASAAQKDVSQYGGGGLKSRWGQKRTCRGDVDSGGGAYRGGRGLLKRWGEVGGESRVGPYGRREVLPEIMGGGTMGGIGGL